MVGYIIGKGGRFTKKILKESKVVMRFEKTVKVKFVKYKEQSTCVMSGKMDDV